MQVCDGICTRHTSIRPTSLPRPRPQTETKCSRNSRYASPEALSPNRATGPRIAMERLSVREGGCLETWPGWDQRLKVDVRLEGAGRPRDGARCERMRARRANGMTRREGWLVSRDDCRRCAGLPALPPVGPPCLHFGAECVSVVVCTAAAVG